MKEGSMEERYRQKPDIMRYVRLQAEMGLEDILSTSIQYRDI